MLPRDWYKTLLGCSLALATSHASAAVTQPDGVVMPLPSPTDEVGLQELFVHLTSSQPLEVTR